MGDALELRLIEIREQREGRDRVHQLVASCHGRMVPECEPARTLPVRIDGPPHPAQHGRLRETRQTMTLTMDETARRLADVPLFAGVPPDGLERISGRVSELDVPADRPIVRQGEIGTGFYIVVSGSVEVIRDGVRVAVLGPGEFFG